MFKEIIFIISYDGNIIIDPIIYFKFNSNLYCENKEYYLEEDEGDILCNEVDLGTVESDFFDAYESALEEGLKQGLTLIEI